MQKWFGIGNPSEQAIEASHSFNACTNLSLCREEVFARFLIAKLRFIGHQRLETRLEKLSDVHNEGRPHVIIKRCINDLKGPMRRQLCSAGIHTRSTKIQFG